MRFVFLVVTEILLVVAYKITLELGIMASVLNTDSMVFSLVPYLQRLSDDIPPL